MLLTARKATAAGERERATSQDSSRCSVSPVAAPTGAVTAPGGGSGGLGALMQRLVSNSKISGGGRLHAATVATGGLVRQELFLKHFAPYPSTGYILYKILNPPLHSGRYTITVKAPLP